jgi:hypothetical protein
MNSYKITSKNSNVGRVLLLFLLFSLAIYEFVHAGFNTFAIVCALPILALLGILAFRHGNLTFWTLIVVNYFLQLKDLSLPIPASLPNEMLEILLLAIAAVKSKMVPIDRIGSIMFGALLVWCGFCVLEVLNDTCNIGINVGAWYAGARMMAFQLLYAFMVYILFITDPKKLTTYLYIWGGLALFAVFWVLKQKTFGFTDVENAWLQSR